MVYGKRTLTAFRLTVKRTASERVANGFLTRSNGFIERLNGL